MISIRIIGLLITFGFLTGCGGHMQFQVTGVSPPGANGSAELIANTTIALKKVVDAATNPLCKSAKLKNEVLDGNVLENNGRADASYVAYQKDCSH